MSATPPPGGLDASVFIANERGRQLDEALPVGFCVVTAPTRWTLADGRDLLFFSLPGHVPAPVSDRRPLPERDPAPMLG